MIKHIEKGEGEKTDLINRCQIVFEKTTQLMKASERNIGKKAYSHGYPSSKVLRDAADEVIKVRKKLRYEQIKYPKDITTIEQLEADLKQKQKQLKTNQNQSEKLRNEDLDRLATKRAEQWNLKASQAIVVIKAAEEAKKLHRKQKNFFVREEEGA